VRGPITWGMSRSLALALTLALAALMLVPAGAGARSRDGRHGVRAACASSHASIERGALRRARLATLCLLNRVRARAGLAPLKLNPKLTRVARRHSREMVRRGYFGHTSANGRSPFDRILRARYVPRNASWWLGENIGWGSASRGQPIALVRMWLASPPHRANILSRTFREIGIGIAIGVPVRGAHAAARGATYTTDFGKHS
jgi:uncharacterized protein YkwD